MTGRLRLAAAVLAMATVAAGPAPAQQPAPGREAALSWLDRGTAAFQNGDIDGATAAWQAAIRQAQALHDPGLEAQALVRRGEAYRVSGHLTDAGVDLRAGLAKAEESRNPALIAAAAGALGSLELAAHHRELAEQLLTRSRDVARQAGDRKLLAAASNDLGNFYAGADRAPEAAAAYDVAIREAEGAGDGLLAATAEINAVRLALQRNDARAVGLLSRAVDRLERLPLSYNRGLVLVSAGSAILDRDGPIPADRRALALRAFNLAQATAAALRNPRLTSLAEGALGRLYQRGGATGPAAQSTERAVFAAQSASAPELSYRWEWQRARLARDQGQSDLALASYRRAVAELQSVRQDIRVEYRNGQSSFQVTFGPLYREFTDLLLRRAAADPGHAAALIREARDTIEASKESELQDYYRDSCVASFALRRQSIETIAPGAAVIYPVSLPDRLELLVSFGQEQRQFTVPLPEARLREEVRQFRRLLEKRTTNEFLVPAQQLYNQVIRPIEPLLAQHRIDTLVIVPDSVFRLIPFAALHDGRNFLIDRYATAVVPSMHLIDPKPLAAGKGNALVLGISHSVQGFPALPNVPREVTTVHEIEGGKLLLDNGFTAASFAAELKANPYNLVHIASHGEFGPTPQQDFLLAHDGKLTMDNLESDIKYGEHRQSALELLVLSACETASGDDRAALGLAGVALKAGARSAVASLWYVSDQASGELVTDFYRALRSGEISKAHALQAAQRQIKGTVRFAHPAYWAPFLLIGNWL